MKKLFLISMLGLALSANAQLTVLESGQTIIGNLPIESISPTADLTICTQTGGGTTISPDGEEMDIQPKYSTKIAIGPTHLAFISCNQLGTILNFRAPGSLQFGTGTIANSLSLTKNALTSLVDIKAPSFLTTSDARLKTNVESLNTSFGKLRDVNAVSYNFIPSSNPTTDEAVISYSADDAAPCEDNRTHFGFIAQEIQKIYPNLVVEDEEGMLAIDYTGFIPLLVEAYKDLSSKVKEQEELIDALLGQKAPSYMPASVNGVADAKASLKQNKPNPFNTTTTIECTVPESVASAFICVYDLQGKQVHRIDIRERGDVTNVIDASYFAPGMYIYALIADGVEIDSKRMIITD